MESRCKIAWPDRVAAIVMALGVVACGRASGAHGGGTVHRGGDAGSSGRHDGTGDSGFHRQRQGMGDAGYQHSGALYAPDGCYPCRGKDKWIIIACENEEEWQSMVRLIGKILLGGGCALFKQARPPATPRGTGSATWRVDAAIDAADGISNPPTGGGRCRHADVRRGSLSRLPSARGRIFEIDASPWGRVTYHGLPGIPSLSAASAARQFLSIGADNGQVFGTILGLSGAEIETLIQAGAIK